MFDINVERLSKADLESALKEIIIKSGFNIDDHHISDDCIVFMDSARRFEMHYIIKNISNGGWTNRKDIYRIQVKNVKEELVTTNKIRTHVLLGLIKYGDEYIVVAWNSYRYTNHETQKSCYVRDKSIIDCYEQGYIFLRDFDQEIWLAKEDRFGLLIRDYLMFNYIGE